MVSMASPAARNPIRRIVSSSQEVLGGLRKRRLRVTERVQGVKAKDAREAALTPTRATRLTPASIGKREV
jgi:hypothetical protein